MASILAGPMLFLTKFVGAVTSKNRAMLAAECRQLKERIEALGIPRMWGAIPAEILADVKRFQEHCAAIGLSAPGVYEDFGNDPEKISATDVLLALDEILLAADPPGQMGG